MGGGGEEREGEPSWQQLRQRALKLLAVRDRTRAELARRLRAEGASDDALNDVFAWLERLGYLNEDRFAENWIRARQGRYGPLRLEAELREKGIDPDRARELVARSAADEEALVATAINLIQRRLEGSAGGHGEVDLRARRRLIAFLIRRGFPAELAERAVVRALGGGEGKEPEELRPLR